MAEAMGERGQRSWTEKEDEMVSVDGMFQYCIEVRVHGMFSSQWRVMGLFS